MSFARFKRGWHPATIMMLALAAGNSACNDTDREHSVSSRAVSQYFSVYVAMPDDTKLAVDVRLPETDNALVKVPTVVEFTRYWRATETQPPLDNIAESVRQSLKHGFAYVTVDVRGSGASFGIREAEFSLAEVRDMPHVIDWIASQEWSDGNVVAMGISYPGNTAELTGLIRSPSLVAAVPRFTDYDWYTSIVLPGGLKNAYITESWGSSVRKLDLNDVSLFGEHVGEASAENPRVIGVKPVDSDVGRSLLASASAMHQQNRSLADNLGDLVFRDEYPSAASLDDAAGKAVSIHNFQNEFEQSAVPMYHWGSWFDAGTAAGILARFTSFDAPYKYVIGAWSHGANYDANPYREKDAPVDPGIDEQYERIFEFSRAYMQPDQPAPKKELLYYTVGENKWKTTEVWPPEGHERVRFWLADKELLSRERPESSHGADEYLVNFAAGTGLASRWSTQLGGGDVWYGDRRTADELLLTYTSLPFDADMELTGTVTVSLQLSSSHDDGAIIVYLEDVDPEGYVRMLTEGEIRLLHRKTEHVDDPVFGPQRSFLAKDGERMAAGQVQQVELALLPMSVVIKKGHSLRIAIAGHDKDTFVRVPANGIPELSVKRNARFSSFIDLPMIKQVEPAP